MDVFVLSVVSTKRKSVVYDNKNDKLQNELLYCYAFIFKPSYSDKCQGHDIVYLHWKCFQVFVSETGRDIENWNDIRFSWKFSRIFSGRSLRWVEEDALGCDILKISFFRMKLLSNTWEYLFYNQFFIDSKQALRLCVSC